MHCDNNYRFFLTQQLNISHCECAPDNCEQANIAFQQLDQSTQHCFERGNIPIRDVARQIGRDARELFKVIDKLLEENRNHHTVEGGCSFSYKQIENDVKVENHRQTENGVIVESQWCHYN